MPIVKAGRARGVSQGAGTRTGRAMVRWLLLTAVLSAMLLAACDGSGKQDVRNAMAAMGAAMNGGDYGRLFDDFSADRCSQSDTRDAFIANLERQPFKLTDVNLLDQNIVIDRGTAYLILTATFEFADGRTETQTFQEALVKEDGGWRDLDCFEGPLGGPG